ncbi:uncharacterized protein LOC109616471 [Esox lucius]|uniref:uncharacterized protein LOC109616471 n=1 Tax=Esox lucius TaxID=8010 RepID=UPI001476C484|nr:uncharacterized protein LOC109616471 [Esox lucius]
MAPPVLLYVDCGCCVEQGQSKLQGRFGGWPDLYIRLDIWHFMRRLAAGCTTDAHPLYPTFMSRLSVCIFKWDAGDVALLRQSQREQLRREGVPVSTNDMVDRHITKNDLALYCRRRTRGEVATMRCIDHLLQELMGDKGRDLLGVPPLDWVRMEHIWRVQQRHVKCIQDVPGVPLYTEKGTTTTKDGVVLTRYRCARGSTSLESYHLHLNRFIPGTSANSLNFQLYLLEGLNRWNQDRAAASLSTKPSSLLSYAGDVVQCVNENSMKVFGRKYVSSFRPPTKYTGELIGMDYLLHQTGQPLQSVDPDTEETDHLLEDLAVDGEEEEEDEGFEEFTLDSTAMDEHNRPGMDRVDSLAECLVELRNQIRLTLNNQQVSNIVEAIFVRLCSIHRSPKKKGNGMLTRWTLILQDYRKIRQLVLAKGAIMQATTLQLVEVNQTTLIQWHNGRVKRQDLALLLQGINLPGLLPVASDPLDPANVRPAVAPPQHQGETLVYPLPRSTAGQAKSKRQSTTVIMPPVAVRPRLEAQRQLFPQASTFPFIVPAAPVLPGAPSYPVPITPRPAPNDPRPAPVPTLYSIPLAHRFLVLTPACPAPSANTCRKCGHHRTAQTGHSQYKGRIYCPATETLKSSGKEEEIALFI